MNFAVFQAGWFACVLAAARGHSWAGIAVVAAIALGHVAMAPNSRAELTLLAAAAVIGAIFDTALAMTGWIRYAGGAANLAPPWIVAMWVLFATTLNISLAWIKSRPFAAIALGAVGGPLAYLAGERLGALWFDERGVALLTLAVGWGVVTPVLCTIARHANGFAPASANSAANGAWRA